MRGGQLVIPFLRELVATVIYDTSLIIPTLEKETQASLFRGTVLACSQEHVETFLFMCC